MATPPTTFPPFSGLIWGNQPIEGRSLSSGASLDPLQSRQSRIEEVVICHSLLSKLLVGIVNWSAIQTAEERAEWEQWLQQLLTDCEPMIDHCLLKDSPESISQDDALVIKELLEGIKEYLLTYRASVRDEKDERKQLEVLWRVCFERSEGYKPNAPLSEQLLDELLFSKVRSLTFALRALCYREAGGGAISETMHEFHNLVMTATASLVQLFLELLSTPHNGAALLHRLRTAPDIGEALMKENASQGNKATIPYQNEIKTSLQEIAAALLSLGKRENPSYFEQGWIGALKRVSATAIEMISSWIFAEIDRAARRSSHFESVASMAKLFFASSTEYQQGTVRLIPISWLTPSEPASNATSYTPVFEAIAQELLQLAASYSGYLLIKPSIENWSERLVKRMTSLFSSPQHTKLLALQLLDRTVKALAKLELQRRPASMIDSERRSDELRVPQTLLFCRHLLQQQNGSTRYSEDTEIAGTTAHLEELATLLRSGIIHRRAEEDPKFFRALESLLTGWSLQLKEEPDRITAKVEIWKLKAAVLAVHHSTHRMNNPFDSSRQAEAHRTYALTQRLIEEQLIPLIPEALLPTALRTRPPFIAMHEQLLCLLEKAIKDFFKEKTTDEQQKSLSLREKETQQAQTMRLERSRNSFELEKTSSEDAIHSPTRIYEATVCHSLLSKLLVGFVHWSSLQKENERAEWEEWIHRLLTTCQPLVDRCLIKTPSEGIPKDDALLMKEFLEGFKKYLIAYRTSVKEYTTEPEQLDALWQVCFEQSEGYKPSFPPSEKLLDELLFAKIRSLTFGLRSIHHQKTHTDTIPEISAELDNLAITATASLVQLFLELLSSPHNGAAILQRLRTAPDIAKLLMEATSLQEDIMTIPYQDEIETSLREIALTFLSLGKKDTPSYLEKALIGLLKRITAAAVAIISKWVFAEMNRATHSHSHFQSVALAAKLFFASSEEYEQGRVRFVSLQWPEANTGPEHPSPYTPIFREILRGCLRLIPSYGSIKQLSEQWGERFVENLGSLFNSPQRTKLLALALLSHLLSAVAKLDLESKEKIDPKRSEERIRALHTPAESLELTRPLTPEEHLSPVKHSIPQTLLFCRNLLEQQGGSTTYTEIRESIGTATHLAEMTALLRSGIIHRQAGKDPKFFTALQSLLTRWSLQLPKEHDRIAAKVQLWKLESAVLSLRNSTRSQENPFDLHTQPDAHRTYSLAKQLLEEYFLNLLPEELLPSSQRTRPPVVAIRQQLLRLLEEVIAKLLPPPSTNIRATNTSLGAKESEELQSIALERSDRFFKLYRTTTKGTPETLTADNNSLWKAIANPGEKGPRSALKQEIQQLVDPWLSAVASDSNLQECLSEAVATIILQTIDRLCRTGAFLSLVALVLKLNPQETAAENQSAQPPSTSSMSNAMPSQRIQNQLEEVKQSVLEILQPAGSLKYLIAASNVLNPVTDLLRGVFTAWSRQGGAQLDPYPFVEQLFFILDNRGQREGRYPSLKDEAPSQEEIAEIANDISISLANKLRNFNPALKASAAIIDDSIPDFCNRCSQFFVALLNNPERLSLFLLSLLRPPPNQTEQQEERSTPLEEESPDSEETLENESEQITDSSDEESSDEQPFSWNWSLWRS